MTAGGRTGKQARARQHTIYCLAADRVLIGRRVEEAGMSFSRFMVTCALHGGDEDDGPEGPRLVLSEDEQRSLYWRVALLNRCNEALLARLPGTEISALGALAFLVEVRMREMVRDAREYELKALLTDLFGERAATATVERLNARMGEEVLDPPRPKGAARTGSHREAAAIARLRLPALLLSVLQLQLVQLLQFRCAAWRSRASVCADDGSAKKGPRIGDSLLEKIDYPRRGSE